jgi:hypothetical protein
VIPESVSRQLARLKAVAAEMPAESLPAVCGALAALQAEILMLPRRPPAGDRLLKPEEVAQRIGRSRDWVYRHRHSLPTTRLDRGRWSVRESALTRWLENRALRVSAAAERGDEDSS